MVDPVTNMPQEVLNMVYYNTSTGEVFTPAFPAIDTVFQGTILEVSVAVLNREKVLEAPNNTAISLFITDTVNRQPYTVALPDNLSYTPAIAGLSQGQAQFSFRVNQGGWYRLEWCANYDNALEETDYGNNCMAPTDGRLRAKRQRLGGVFVGGTSDKVGPAVVPMPMASNSPLSVFLAQPSALVDFYQFKKCYPKRAFRLKH